MAEHATSTLYTRLGGYDAIAAVADDWLTFELRFASPLGDEIELLARAGSSLGGGAKFTCSPEGSLALGFEVRVDTEIDVAPLLHAALDGVSAGLRVWSLTAASRAALDGSRHARSRFVAFQGTSEPLRVEELRQLAEEAGWPVKVREQAVVADLAVADGFFQATLAAEAQGLRVFTEVQSLTGLVGDSRRATALALLRLNGAVRSVAGSIYGSANHEAARLSVQLPARPDTARLGESLTALSATCRWAHRELAALADPQLAGAYLAMSGFPHHQPVTVTTNTTPP